jgi:hypothetical protein
MKNTVIRPETKIPKGAVFGENKKLVVATGRKEAVEKVGELLERRFAAYVGQRRRRKERGGERRREEGGGGRRNTCLQ